MTLKEACKVLGASVQNIGEPLDIFLREDRAVVEEIVTGKVLGIVSFDEDECCD